MELVLGCVIFTNKIKSRQIYEFSVGKTETEMALTNRTCKMHKREKGRVTSLLLETPNHSVENIMQEKIWKIKLLGKSP